MALITCPECGKEVSDKAEKCPNCGNPLTTNNAKVTAEVITQKGFWSSGRLTIGIISILLFVLVSFQSCAVGFGNALEQNKNTTGTNGIGFALFVLIAGIVGICTRNSKGRVGTVITTVLYWLASVLTVDTGNSYGDLPIWGALSFAFGIVFLISAIKTKKE